MAPPEPPAELERTDEVGAAAAAEYFVSLYGYTMQTGDVVPWTTMSADVCGFCARIRQDAQSIRENGERYSGGDIALSNVVVLTKDDLIGGYPVEAQFTQEPVRRMGGNSEVISETEGDSGAVRIDTINADGSWRIMAVVVGGGTR